MKVALSTAHTSSSSTDTDEPARKTLQCAASFTIRRDVFDLVRISPPVFFQLFRIVLTIRTLFSVLSLVL